MPKTEYTVATKNRFAQLDSDVELEPASPASPKPVTKAPASSSINNTDEHLKKKQLRRKNQRPVGGETTSPPPPVTSRLPGHREKKPTDTADAPADIDPLMEPRGMRRRRPPFSDDKRKPATRLHGRLDRQSATGRGKEMKKSGEGSHNWGNETSADVNLHPSVEASGPEVPESDDKTSVTYFGRKTSPEDGQTDPDPSPSEPVTQQMTDTPGYSTTSVTSQERIIPFAEYQRKRKMKRAMLQAQNVPSSNVRHVDAVELEKDGYQRYEREETHEERVARERCLQKLQRGQAEETDDSDVDRPGRVKTRPVPLFEFSGGSLSQRRRQGGQRGGNRSSASGIAEESGQRSGLPNNGRNRQPDHFDLADTAAFPVLD